MIVGVKERDGTNLFGQMIKYTLRKHIFSSTIFKYDKESY